MKSRTKFQADFALITEMFAKAGLPTPEHAEPLGAGEFNTVMSVTAGAKKYALKIAPSASTPVLRYERNMMQAEVYWYDVIAKSGAVAVPTVIYSDFSRTLAPADWFIMTQIEGVHPTTDAIGNMDRAATELLAGLAARLNNVHCEKFGYVQGKEHDDWHSAIRAMVCDLIADASDKKKSSRRGKKLLRYIDFYADVLRKAECRMVNFDLWSANVFLTADGGGLCLIDPERSFRGDRVADFVCLELTKKLDDKCISFSAYNRQSDSPISITREIKIRYAVAAAYLALIQEVEKYYRYTPFMFGWWRNVFSSAFLYSNAFRILKSSK